MLRHANEEDFNKKLDESSKVVLVDFFATWCGPCQMLSPILEKISNSRADFDIIKVDVDEARKLAEKLGIEVVPTMFMYKDKKPVRKIEGVLDENEIINIMGEYID